MIQSAEVCDETETSVPADVTKMSQGLTAMLDHTKEYIQVIRK